MNVKDNGILFDKEKITKHEIYLIILTIGHLYKFNNKYPTQDELSFTLNFKGNRLNLAFQEAVNLNYINKLTDNNYELTKKGWDYVYRIIPLYR